MNLSEQKREATARLWAEDAYTAAIEYKRKISMIHSLYGDHSEWRGPIRKALTESQEAPMVAGELGLALGAELEPVP